jgi:WW domain-containing oxidoreductase
MKDNFRHSLFFSHINKKTTFTDPRLAFAEPIKTSPHDFRQKFDGNSTALQVLNGRDLSGKYAIVTGASGGIGNVM